MDRQDTGMYRMMDANADRAAEGLRVVCDVARFVLNHPVLAGKWREIRSELWKTLSTVPGLQRRGLESRDSQSDIGRSFQSARRWDLLEMARDNIHRAQESFRVLEETLRAIDPGRVSAVSELRYRCYEAEPEMMAAMDAWASRNKLDFHLYVVLGQEFSKGRDYLEVAEKVIAGGAGAIQLRAKDSPKREILDWAYRLRALTKEKGVTFFVNDHLDIALAVDADGVHLGQDDFPIREARRIAGPSFLLGASTHNLDEAKKAADDGASYINIGPIFPTGTKKHVVSAIGPESITEISRAIDLPFTVMGGIKIDNIDQVLQRGARRIAVVTAVVAQDDMTAAAQELTAAILRYDQQSMN